MLIKFSFLFLPIPFSFSEEQASPKKYPSSFRRKIFIDQNISTTNPF